MRRAPAPRSVGDTTASSGGFSGFVPSEMATLSRREKLIASFASRSAATRSRGGAASSVGDDEEPVGPQHNDSAFGILAAAESFLMPTLHEQLLQRVEHHGVQRVFVDESSAKSLPVDPAPSRKPYCYQCLPCEQQLTKTRNQPPEEDDLATVIYHCSSASHRLFARLMCLPEIDVSLVTTPVPTPSMHSSISVNGIKMLVSSMPGGSDMFHPLQDETKEAAAAVDEAFMASLASAGRKPAVSPSLKREYQTVRPRRILHHFASAAPEHGGESVFPPSAASDFWYHPLRQLCDTSSIWIPSARSRVRPRDDDTAESWVASCESSWDDAGTSLVRQSWRRIPSSLFRGAIHVQYEIRSERESLHPPLAVAVGSVSGDILRTPVRDGDSFRIVVRAASMPRRRPQQQQVEGAVPQNNDSSSIRNVLPLTQDTLQQLETMRESSVASGHDRDVMTELSFFNWVKRYAAHSRVANTSVGASSWDANHHRDRSDDGDVSLA